MEAPNMKKYTVHYTDSELTNLTKQEAMEYAKDPCAIYITHTRGWYTRIIDFIY